MTTPRVHCLTHCSCCWNMTLGHPLRRHRLHRDHKEGEDRMSDTTRISCTEPGCRSELLCHERRVDNLEASWRCLEHRQDPSTETPQTSTSPVTNTTPEEIMSEINGHDKLTSQMCRACPVRALATVTASKEHESAINNLGATLMLVLGSACPHCKSTVGQVQMGGNTWGIETFHEAACPEANQAAAEPPDEDDSNTQE